MSNQKYTRAKALVVGIDHYEQANQLDNAVNDAKAIADILRQLKFYVCDFYDIDIDKWDEVFSEFCCDLDKYDACVVYFAGHGVEIDGKNYLLCKNTPAGNKGGTVRYSIDLQASLDAIKTKNCNTNIIIIDACRNNPFPEDRAVYAASTLAPIFAPKGTLIAYSTSPGQKADDKGMGDHSYYTGALLQHITEIGLPIESFFKKVRTTVYNLSNEQQTSWEHTSLIGNFSFNSGQLIQNLNVGGYADKVICREDYDYSDAEIADIVRNLCSTQFDEQRRALAEMKRLNMLSLTKDEQFLLGRCCCWAAYCNCFDCQNFFDDSLALARYTCNGHNHFMNGVLFELYYCSDGTFASKPDYDQLERLMRHCHDVNLKCSFEYIHQVLIPFANQLLFMPSPNSEKVSIDVTYEDGLPDDDCIVISSIRHDVDDLLELFAYTYGWNITSEDVLAQKIAEVCCIPYRYISVNSNKPNYVGRIKFQKDYNFDVALE